MEGERVVSPAAYKANDKPYETFAAGRSGRRLAKLCLRGELWAADKETATFCGVKFVECEQDDDGEWVPKAAKKGGKKPQPPKE